MRDYQADEIKGADYIKQKTPFQRRRDSQIAENERLYLASERKAEDIRNFLVRARYFTEPDVSKKKYLDLYLYHPIFTFTAF